MKYSIPQYIIKGSSMAILLWLLLVLAGPCGLLAGHVIELTDDNFDTVVMRSDFIVVEFYTKW